MHAGAATDQRASLRAARQHMHRDLDEPVADFDLTDPWDDRKFLRPSYAFALSQRSFAMLGHEFQRSP
jgi:hypothetical protein